MNTENLEVGMIFKNYGELCKHLEIEPVKGGRNVELQKKDIGRFLEFEKQGRSHSLIITKIHDEVRSKKIGNTADYIEHTEILLMQLLLANNKKALTVSESELARRLNFIHQEFTNYYGARGQLKEIMDIDYVIINDFMRSVNSTYSNAINTTLKRLKSKMAIIYELRWSVKVFEYNEYTKKNEWVYRFATMTEKQNIINVRAKILKEHFEGNAKYVSYGESMKRYYQMVDSELYNLMKVGRAYETYEITFNHDVIEEEYIRKLKLEENMNVDEILNLKNIINDGFSKRIKDNAQNRHDKELVILSSNKRFGEAKDRKSEVRACGDYMDGNVKLIDALVHGNIDKYKKA